MKNFVLFSFPFPLICLLIARISIIVSKGKCSLLLVEYFTFLSSKTNHEMMKEQFFNKINGQRKREREREILSFFLIISIKQYIFINCWIVSSIFFAKFKSIIMIIINLPLQIFDHSNYRAKKAGNI